MPAPRIAVLAVVSTRVINMIARDLTNQFFCFVRLGGFWSKRVFFLNVFELGEKTVFFVKTFEKI
jgi:hypothetical protein